MSLAPQLLEQARHLAARDAVGRPRQANLRRAVSAAYYALFRFLIDEACKVLLGSDPQGQALRAVTARAFDHAAMKKAATSFASGTLPAKLAPGLGGAAIPAELRQVALTFQVMQERRHAADYDMLLRFDRAEVIRLIDRTDRALQLWANVRNSATGRLFLVALLVGERIRE
jgi:hypothetical protein